jgi:hypothetical protein
MGETHYSGDFTGRYLCGQTDAGAYAARGEGATCGTCQRCAEVRVRVSSTKSATASGLADAIAALDGWEVTERRREPRGWVHLIVRKKEGPDG